MRKKLKKILEEEIVKWKGLLDYLEQEDKRRAQRIKAKTHSKRLAPA